MRKIIHIDMDAFYASVEQRDDPALKQRPVIVGGDPNGRGVVAAASYEARRCGVHSAMSASHARRLCPHGVFLAPDMPRYRRASERIFNILAEVTEKVETLALDEAYLDVTTNEWDEPSASRLARRLKERIWTRLKLTASAGVGPNKMVAKVASGLRKPDGLVVIPPGRVPDFVSRLPVEKLWGVGPATARRLHALGAHTGEDVRRIPLTFLEQTLGKQGRFLYDICRGADPREVLPNRAPKRRGAETTFSADVEDLPTLEACLGELAERVSENLKDLGVRGRTITLKVRYGDFETISRQRTLGHSTGDCLEIARVARELLRSSTEATCRPVRLLGVTVTGLDDPGEPQQLELAV